MAALLLGTVILKVTLDWEDCLACVDSLQVASSEEVALTQMLLISSFLWRVSSLMPSKEAKQS